jgi:hypothetical protein
MRRLQLSKASKILPQIAQRAADLLVDFSQCTKKEQCCDCAKLHCHNSVTVALAEWTGADASVLGTST